MQKTALSTLLLLFLMLTSAPGRAFEDWLHPMTIEDISSSSTESILSTLIDQHVSAISGEFIDCQTDLMLVGPEPLCLQRSYSSNPRINMWGYFPTALNPRTTYYVGNNYCLWQFNHLNRLHLLKNCKDNKKKSHISVLAPNMASSLTLYSSRKTHNQFYRSTFEMSFDQSKGFTNCSMGAISGKTNPHNMKVFMNVPEDECDVIFGSGARRNYKAHNYEYTDQCIMTSAIFFPQYEVKPNGNRIEFTNNDGMIAKSKSGSKVFGWMRQKEISPTEIHYENSHMDPVIYRYQAVKLVKDNPHDFSKSFLLSSITRPDQPKEEYTYGRDFGTGDFQLIRKKLPEGRFLEIDYYKLNDTDSGYKLSPIIASRFDPRMKRVKELRAPVGPDETPIITRRFKYNVSRFIDNKKGYSTTANGYTTVFDAYDHMTRYYYNNEQRISVYSEYIDGKRYRSKRYLWNENGNLSAKLSLSSQKIVAGRFFKYDQRGNILTEKLLGNLSGRCNHTIHLDDDGKPKKNGIEVCRKSYSYSNDDFNLLLTEKEANGKVTHYAYYENSDLLKSKFILDGESIRLREFFFYDRYNALNKIIRDDGSEPGSEDLTGVTERYITYYNPRNCIPFGLPQKIEEYALDLNTGLETLIKFTVQSYSNVGKLLSEELFDADGLFAYRISWDYDAHGNIIKECNAVGDVITRQFDANDNLIFEQGPSYDYFTTHSYDFSNRRIRSEIIHLDGQHFITHYRYDYLGNCIAKVDRYGNETLYRYDEFNRLIETTLPAVQDETLTAINPSVKTEYNELDHPIVSIDENGFETVRTFNIRGKLTSVTYPDSTNEQFIYDVFGQLIKKIAKNGSWTCYEYDTLGRQTLEAIHNEEGDLLCTTSAEFNSFHQISSTDAMGLTTYFHYDFAGRLVKTECDEKLAFLSYDSLGRLIKKIERINDQESRISLFAYDLLNRLTEERIESSEEEILSQVFYQYDIEGNRTHIIEDTAAGTSCSVTTYNSDKQPTQIIDGRGAITYISYDYQFRNSLGQFVLQTRVTDPLGNITITTCDALGRAISTEKQDFYGQRLSLQELVYDLKGNPVRIIDHLIEAAENKRQVETKFNYNSMSQIISLIQAAGLPEQQITRTVYNPYGEKQAIIKPDGIALQHEYDALGRLTRHFSDDHTFDYCYEYNRNSQPVEISNQAQNKKTVLSYDSLGRLKSEELENGVEMKYAYDLLGRVTEVTLPDATKIGYRYDAAHLKEVMRLRSNGSTYSHHYDAYDRAGLLTKARSVDDTSLTFSYNLAKRPESIETTFWKESNLQYDLAGQLLSFTVQDARGKINRSFSYDSLGHLISEDEHLYSCDSLHNRIHKDGVNYFSNGLNQLVKQGDTTYEYDPNGNLIKKNSKDTITEYKYDVLDRLIEVTQGSQRTVYTYDAFHRRLSKNETSYLYMGQTEIGSIDNQGVIQELRIIGKGLGGDIGATVAIELNDRVFAVTNDHNGNIVSLTEGNRAIETYRYTAFGEKIIDESDEGEPGIGIANPWQFSSKRFDQETGLIYFGRRYYDPDLGRWITPDPAGFIDGNNLYSYLHHHPLTSIDPYGLSEEGSESDGGIRHPIADVEIDHDEQQIPDDDTTVNTPDIEYIQKKNGRKVKLYHCGFIQIGELGISIINGIMTNLKNAYDNAMMISSIAQDYRVEITHNRSTGFVLTDIIRCMFELYFGLTTQSVRDQKAKWNAFFDNNPDNVYLLHNCHSEGAIVTRNALWGMREEYRKRIIVIAIAPAAYIDSDLVANIYHYRSSRDIVPLFDAFGAWRCRNTTTILSPKSDSPWFDHAFNSPTYRGVQKDHMNDFIHQFGARA